MCVGVNKELVEPSIDFPLVHATASSLLTSHNPSVISVYDLRDGVSHICDLFSISPSMTDGFSLHRGQTRGFPSLRKSSSWLVQDRVVLA